MILELIFLSGLATGLLATLILIIIFYKDDEFEERQKRYRKMI